MNARKLYLLAVAIFGTAMGSFALDGREIMQNVHDVKKPRFSHSAVKMDLIDKSGAVESRQVEQWGKHESDLTSVVMIFYTPASIKDTRFLQVENEDRDDDKWIYLPALRSTRRIASSEGSKSFVGTDFTYDDMSSREVDQDVHEFVRREELNGYDCFVVKSVPKDPADSQYAYRVSHVDSKTWVPIRVEMYDKRDSALLKRLTIEKLENISGYWITMSGLMENVKTNHSTRLAIMKIEVDKPLSAKLFTPGFLNTGRL